MNHAENRHSRPKNGRLTAIFVFGKMPKFEPINIFFARFSPDVSYDYSE